MRCALIPSNPTPPNAGCPVKVKCKRCDKPLLLKSERELALCTICQRVLSRPPLIDFERTNNEPSYLFDDLYCCEKPSDLSAPCPSRPRPTTPCAYPLDFPPQRCSPKKHGVVGLFLSSIIAITITLLTVIHLRPHLAGLDGFDLLAIAACVFAWRIVFKEVGENVK